MSRTVQDHLVKQLSEGHAMEKQALLLLNRAAAIVGDEEIARIYEVARSPWNFCDAGSGVIVTQ